MSVQHNVFVLGNPVNTIDAVFIPANSSIQQYENKHGTIQQTNYIRNLFIDVNTYKDVIEFRIQNPTVHRDAIFKQSIMEEIPNMIAVFKNDSLTPTYDIFSGQRLKSPDLRPSVSKHLNIFMFVLTEFLDAGYYNLENRRKVQDWCICFSDPIMEYFINYFEIKTQSPDIHLVDEFLTNPQFRQMITECMLHVAAHYAINNNIITHIELLNTNWSDTKIIKKIQYSL